MLQGARARAWLMRRCSQARQGSSYSVLPRLSCTTLGSCFAACPGSGHSVLTTLGCASGPSPSADCGPAARSVAHTSTCAWVWTGGEVWSRCP